LELKEVDEKKKKQVIASFSPELQKRYQRMVRMKEDIEQKCSSSEMGNMIGAEELVKLNGYLDSFVYFMEFRAQCMATKLSIDVGEIEGRIRRLEMEVKNDEEVPERKQVNSLRQETIKMSREILDRFQRLDSYIAMVDAQAEAIENALKLLQVRLATSNFQAEGEVELVSSDMNNLLASIHSTEKSIEEASKDMIKIKKLSRLSIP
ncbi:MAG: hypothetical protein L7F78_16920, partial [Syntrophales bacterium LBB04]|nr:hypothetical protein [Syntrophales bacterium LBB04]